jgi:hypothetical protein
MGFFTSMEQESVRITRRQQRAAAIDRQADRMAASTDMIRFTRGISTMAEMYPWMQPGAIVSAASAGLDATMPESRQLAALAAVDRLASPLGLRDAWETSYGYSPSADQLARRVNLSWQRAVAESEALGGSTNLDLWRRAVSLARQGIQNAEHAQDPFGDPTGFVTAATGGMLTPPSELAPLGAHKGYARQQAAVETLESGNQMMGPPNPAYQRRLVERSLRQLTGEVPLSADQRSRFIDRADPEEFVAARAGFRDSPGQQQRRAAENGLEMLRDRYGTATPDENWDPVDAESFTAAELQLQTLSLPEHQAAGVSLGGLNPLTPVLRGLGIAMNAPLQLLQAGYRTSWSDISSPRDAVETLGHQTDLGLILNELGQGRDVDVGGGFFVDPDSAVGRQRYLNEIAQGDVGGHVVTIGRRLTDQIMPFEPDTLPFDIMSGAIDAFVAVRGDPLNPVMDMGAAAIASRAGALNGTRRVLSAERATEWLGSDEAVDVARVFAATDASDSTAVYRLWRNSDRQIPMPVLRRLVAGDADDTQYVLDTLRGHVGLDIRRAPRARDLQGWRRRPSQARLAQMMPSASIVITDPDSAVLTVERYYQNLRAGEDLVARRVVEAADMFRPQQVSVDLSGLDPSIAQDIERSRGILRGIAGEGPLPDDLRGLSDDELAAVAEDLAYELEDALTPVSRASLVMEPDRNAWYEFATRVMADDTDGLLQAHGVPSDTAHRMTRLWRERQQTEFKGWVDDIGQGRRINGTLVDGEWVGNVSPHLFVEGLNSNIPLPDARTLRRMTANRAIGFLVRNPDYEARMPLTALNWVQDNVWKTSVLIRLAWPVRVIGEEQLRLGAAGLDSAFRHPISYIAWLTGKGGTDVFGTPLRELDEFARAMAGRTGGWLDSQAWRHTGQWGTARRMVDESTGEVWFQEGYERWWAEEMAKLHADPIATAVQRARDSGRSLDDVAEALWDGSLQGYRRDFARTQDFLNHRRSAPTTYAERVAAGDDVLRSVDDWVESIAMRIDQATGGNSELLEAVRTGKMTVKSRRGTRDVPLMNPESARIDRAFTQRLRDLAPTHGPGAVAGPIIEKVDWTGASRVVETMFATLMSRPTNYLSRSPAFRQFYWQRMGDLMSYGTIDAQQQILKAAADAGLDRAALRNLRRSRDSIGMSSLEELDTVAKGHALDDTQELLYDLSDRSQFFDAARLIFPFGEAWKEVITRWGQMTVQQGNLRPLRRLQQVVEEARENTAINEYAPGENPVPGEGFFWTNAWDEEVFIYPGSQWASDKFVGIPIPLTGRTQGLSLATEIYPGLGLVIQVPAQFVLQTKPSFGPFDTGGVPIGDTRPLEAIGVGSTLRELVLPFGERSSFWAQSVPPAWRTLQLAAASLPRDHWLAGPIARAAQWMEESPDSDRVWGSTVADIARYLYSTGDYQVDDPEDQERAWRDAASMAPNFFLLRAIGQFSLPSSPAGEFLVRDGGDSDGSLVRAAVLTQDWQELLARPGVDYWDSVQDFIDLHGEENRLILQAKTDSISLNFPLHDRGFRWMNANPDIVEDYPSTFGLMAPGPEDPEDPDFSSEAWRASLDRGDRVGLSAEEDTGPVELNQMRRLDQHRIATLRFRQAEEWELGQLPEGTATLPEEAQARLDRFKRQLRDDFPGYQNFVGLPQGIDNEYRERLIGEPGDRDAEVRAAARDDRTPQRLRGGLNELLQAWDYALADAEAQGYATLNNEAMAPVRRWLRYEFFPDLTRRNPMVAGYVTFVFDPLLDDVEAE